VWQGQWTSGEDHFLEKAEIVLSRVDPGAIAKVIRRIVSAASARNVDAIYSLAHRLEEYDLLLDRDSRNMLEAVRQSSAVIEGPADSKGMHAEFFLFSRVLPLWTGTGQLERLLARSQDAHDWIDLENYYQGPVEGSLPEATTPKDCFRTLYYLSILGEDKLSDDALQSANATDDSLVRGSLYRYFLSSNVPMERVAPFISDWSWKVDMHHMEQTFGSLLLIKLLQRRSFRSFVEEGRSDIPCYCNSEKWWLRGRLGRVLCMVYTDDLGIAGSRARRRRACLRNHTLHTKKRTTGAGFIGTRGLPHRFAL
jgi:hypothetical protein